ncbi:MAG: glycosyltransferase [Gammaproteobacteria bacterium]|nr:glycosyltransferase [Gammaproteobacteria bacterium]
MAIGLKEIATRLYRMDKYEIRTFGWFAHTAEQRGVKWNFPWRQYTTSDHARPYGHPQGYPLNPNWDTCPVVKIIDDFKPDVVIVIGDYWMCFPAGTNIKTPHGTKKIEDIVEGDDVYTHKGRIRQVKKTLKRKYNGDLIKIDYIGNNKSIYCTPEHPFLKSPDEFIKAEKLKVGDFLLSPITEYKEKNKIYDLSKYCFRKDDKHCWEKTSKKHNRFVSLDSDLCRTIGYYLAEGYCSPRGVYFTFSSKEKTIAKDLSNTIYDKIGIKSKILYFDTYIRVQFHSRILSLFFKELCDTGSRDKKLHNDLLHLSEEKTIQIIKGYFLGDGHIDKNRSGVSFTTRSKFLAYQIKNTIERLGIIASIYERLDERRLKTKSCGINFVVHIGGIDKNKFKDIMGFKYEVKKGSHSKNYIEDGYIYRKIKNITHIKAEDIYVYNFEVEEDNSYVANEIAVHNCEYLYDMPNRSQVKLLHEMPIDGSPIPMSWIKAFKKADIPIVMSEFAVDAIKEKDEYFKVELNPRGLDTSIFFPQTLDRPKDFLRKNFMSSAIGRFVVGIFNRFQDRKQIGRSIEAFSKFVTKYNHKDCDLYLHCDFQDSASIQQGKTLIGEDGLLKRYGLDGKILFNKNITVEQGVSAQELAATYNCCDVVLNTTQGEGFGLCVHPDTLIQIPSGVKEIKNIEIGDKVLTETGEYHSVLTKTKRKVEELYEVNIVNCGKILVTKEHPFLATINKRYSENKKLEWKNITELKKGNFVATPKPKSKSLKLKKIDLLDFDNSLESDNEYVWYKMGYSGNKEGISLNQICEKYNIGKKCAERAVRIANGKCKQNFTKNCNSYKISQKIKNSISREQNKYKRFINIDDDFLYFLGWYLAEGCIGNGYVTLHCGIKDKYNLVKIEKWLDNNGFKYSYKDKKNKPKNLDFHITNSILPKVCDYYCSKLSWNKKINNELMESPDILLPLVKGYILGDGHINKKHISFTTVSRNLAHQIRLILIKHGIVFKISKKEAGVSIFNINGQEKRYSKTREAYIGQINGTNAIKFFRLMGIVSDYNKSERSGRHAIDSGNYILLPIRSIKKIKYNNYVYDINVQDVHSFVGNGILLHNTTAESLACGIPNIVTNYTTPVEFAKSGGIKLIDVITTITGMYNVERALADTDHAADLLEELYRSPKTRKDMGIKGAEWAKQFNWENNIQNWVSYIERCLRGLEYKPISKTKERVLDLEPNVNIQGAVFENTGFSIVTKNLAKALDIIGVNVSLEPRVPHLAKFFKVEDRINKLINKDKNTVFEFINHMGQEQLERLPASKAKYKIAYFPWELSNIKNEWVDGLNKYADAVWCNSQFTSDIYKNAGIQEDKLFVLPNGICFPEVDRERDDDKTYKFLCIGNLGDKRKNVETLIQSYLSEFNGDEDVELILKTQPGHIDSDPTELVEFLSRSKTNAPKITIIHADYTDEALAQLMKNCDCFVTASHAEGFCHPILEATSMGMPVIAPMYGGYLEFAQNGKFFGVAVDISEATKSPVYYYNSRWSNVKFRELMRVMREVFVNKIMPDGINYVPEHTWENTAIKMRDELKNVAKRASRKKTKIYYHNFTYNLWNNDNRTNFMRYAPSDIEFVDDFENADLQIIDITRLSDKHNIKCKNYIVNMHCKGEVSEENIMYYADIFQNAQMVYSHLDLEGEMTGSDKWTVEEFKKRINFVRGPWGVDEDLFFNMSGNQKAYTMLTTGAVAPTEAIAECLYACQAVKGKLLHIGPNMFQNAEGYLNTRNLTIREMSASYSLSYYTNAMRRIEGFEKVFSEGVLSSSRPICFDTPLYRHWYKDIPRYVKEGTPDEVIKDLIEIFKSPYKPITEEEKQFVIDNFSWIKVSKKFWKNFKRIRRTKDDRSN